jgi:hypothetical protein
LKDLPDCAVTEVIIALKLLQADFGELKELAHSFFMLSLDLLTRLAC